MTHRPEGFENPYPEDFRNGKPYGDARIWEDCAETMLELLRKDGIRGPLVNPNSVAKTFSHAMGMDKDVQILYDGRSGTWVFIPDDD